MGLDMYLFKRTIGVPKNKEAGDDVEVAYWRKANQIRRWFVDHTDYGEDNNCAEHPITKNDLEKLVIDCKKVLDNHNLAEELMPTESGFFFGRTDYDEWYFEDLKNTVEQVENVLNNTNWDNEEVYYYEWW